MAPTILLVNPPIYDFCAYDFWLKPYGALSVAGYLRGKAEFSLFDYLDREHDFAVGQRKLKSMPWGVGEFYSQTIPSPDCVSQIPRHFRRFGLPRVIFEAFLAEHGPCDYVFVQTGMTYWYKGVEEVIGDVRRAWPKAKIIAGGNYVTLCGKHAEKLGADLLVTGTELGPLWEYLNVEPDMLQPALWEAYEKLNVGVMKLSDGCPFRCSYCSVPKVYGNFKARPLERSLAELRMLCRLGVENIAFYDDALLFDKQEVLMPFLNEVLRLNIKVNFHTPNALGARFITSELAELMVQSGFKSFYLGFESVSEAWQEQTGAKVYSDELAEAVRCLVAAGAERQSIVAYQLLGHPKGEVRELEATMRFVNKLGIRGMLADYSPIPGTSDGEDCRKWVDMDEPLLHNKTAFPIVLLGNDQVNRLKDLQRKFNHQILAKSS